MENVKTQSTVMEMGGTEGARRATGVTPIKREPDPPDPEVLENKPRRRFTAKYKLRILEEADACTEPGQIGALLRREGLYSSNLTIWRRQRDEGQLQGLSPKKRGRKAKAVNPLAQRVAELERETQQLREKLRKAEIIIEVQKKVSEILGIPQDPNDENNS
jgi:transposase-like protein